MEMWVRAWKGTLSFYSRGYAFPQRRYTLIQGLKVSVYPLFPSMPELL